MLTLKILGALAALGFGIWLGLAGEYRPDFREIEDAIDKERPTRKTKKHFTFLNAFMNRKAPPRARKRHGGRRTPFSQR